jgi:hypothetical protein
MSVGGTGAEPIERRKVGSEQDCTAARMEQGGDWDETWVTK